jgi:hypothetical protein
MPTIIEMTAIEANSSGISDVTQTNVIQATSTSGESLKSLTNRLRIKSELGLFQPGYRRVHCCVHVLVQPNNGARRFKLVVGTAFW